MIGAELTMKRTMRRTAILAFAAACTAMLTAQSALKYPQPRKDNTVDTYFGTKVADPYRWMEDLNSPELKRWIEQENAITFKYLDGLPMRDALKKRITE